MDPMSVGGGVGVSQFGGDSVAIKDRMITELTLENRRLKEDLAKTHYAKF